MQPDLSRQSLGRALESVEQRLAEVLEAIFAAGVHDFDAVAAELTQRDVKRPSGQAGAWTADVLNAELVKINASLDDAYSAGGRTRLAG